MVLDSVNAFLAERGYVVGGETDGNQRLELRSLDYVALLMHVERDLKVRIDDAVFFAEGLPETLATICERLAQAKTQMEGEPGGQDLT